MKLALTVVAAVYCLSESASATVNPAQLQAWQSFYDETGGSAWTRCKNKRDNPCTCEGTTDATVTCAQKDGQNFITSVKLKDNNLVADSYPTATINLLIGANPTFDLFDIRNNPSLQNPSGACLPVPNCVEPVRCRFDADLCAVTGTTTAPTTGTTNGTGTVTMAPTVANITAAPVAPNATTFVPTTDAPTSSLTAVPTTAAPSARGDTLTPTTVQTQTPSMPPSNPPTPITTSTQPPSSSAGSVPMAGMLGSIVVAVAVLMM